MHLTASPCSRPTVLDSNLAATNDDRILRTLMEADAAVRELLLAHICDGDAARWERLSSMVRAVLQWREADQGPKRHVRATGS